jgi:hypothetical protein
MSKSLNEEIFKVVNTQIDEATFAELAQSAARSAQGRLVAGALLANPVGGVQTNPGSRPISIEVPQGSVETVVKKQVHEPDVVTTKTVPTTNFVSTRPEPAIPGTQQETTIGHGTFEFTGQAHPLHGTPVIKDGQIKPGADTFKVNTATGETHRLNPNNYAWTKVSHFQYVAPSRDQIEQRSAPGSATHTAIQAAKAQDTVVPGTPGSPAVPSKLMAVPGTREVTSTIPGETKTVFDTTSVPAQSIRMNIPGSPVTTSLVPRSDQYMDTSKPVGIERRRETELTTPEEKTITPPVISNDLPANTDERLNRTRETERVIPSSTTPLPPPTPPAPRTAPLVPSFTPGRSKFGGRGAIKQTIGDVPVYSKPEQGTMVPEDPRRPGQPRRFIKSHYEQQGDNMISEEKKMKMKMHKKEMDKKKKDMKESYKEKLYNLLFEEKHVDQDQFIKKAVELSSFSPEDRERVVQVERGDHITISDHIVHNARMLHSALRSNNTPEIEKRKRSLEHYKVNVDQLIRHFHGQ